MCPLSSPVHSMLPFVTLCLYFICCASPLVTTPGLLPPLSSPVPCLVVSVCVFSLTVRLHAHLSQITAIVRLCYSIRQLQLSEYTCRWKNRIIGWSMSYPSTKGGTVPISTSGNRSTSDWPLYVTSSNKLPWHSRKMAYEERDKALSLYISYMVYMIITQTRCSLLRWFWRKDTAAIPLLLAHSPRKEISRLRRAQNPIQSDRTYTCRSNATINRNNLGVLIRLWLKSYRISQTKV